MREITTENAVSWLRARGHLPPTGDVRVTWLAWGVSNVVLKVEPAGAEPFVVKQSREQLRTRAAWFSRLDRIHREMDAMALLAPRLPAGAIPRILFEERDDYLFGMEAVDPSHVVWKQELLDGTADRGIATAAGALLADIHRTTADDAAVRARLHDREVFDQLRLDPFYRRVAEVHADLKPALDRLIDEALSRSDCLVHADFSPKNLLIVSTPPRSGETAPRAETAPGSPRRVVLVDHETAHVGDPAFDLGFFFSHLLLKTIRHAARSGEFLNLARAAWTGYRDRLGGANDADAFREPDLDRRAAVHLAGCLLARIDGKSPIDYLPEAGLQDFARRHAKSLLSDPTPRFTEAFDRLERALASV